MKLLKSVLAISVVVSLASVAYASNYKPSNSPMYQVPFYNVLVTDKVLADYSFEPHSQTLYCYRTGGDAIEVVGWEYKGVHYKGQLPLELKDDAEFTGQYADPSGKLTISAPYHHKLVVTCEYINKNN